MTRGLRLSEVEKARSEFGKNEISQKKRMSFIKQYLQSFNDPIIKILLAALVLNILLLFRNPNQFETLGIAAAVFLATFVSTLSEYGSEKAFEKLQAEASKINCRVMRDGQQCVVAISDIVVGDLVLLQAGEKVPADGYITAGKVLVNQSPLNGESAEKVKTPQDAVPASWGLSNTCQLFMGSTITGGEGSMCVSRVGDSTFYGSMAVEMQSESLDSPLKVRLSALARIISKIGYIAAILVTFADLFNLIVIQGGFHTMTPSVLAGQILHALTLGITVVVVAVPEGLPMMITVVLSSNMFKMLKDNVMVRKLVGIETAGSLNILFTDKTGTLTNGKLDVTSLYLADGTEYKNSSSLKGKIRELVGVSGYINSGSSIVNGSAIGGNATDRALLEYVIPLRFKAASYTRKEYFPFNSTDKFSAATVSGTGFKTVTLIKGSPEKILPTCTQCYSADGNLQPIQTQNVYRKLNELTSRAIRVIAIAVSDNGLRFEGLTLIGLVGIRDEIRREAKKAVMAIQRAGISVVTVTGDNKETAEAIANECGLMKGKVITGDELRALSEDEISKILPELRVVARALPTDKSLLIKAAQKSGLVTGMTGDGINDAPALRNSDVGFAMGSGTEVAKEAGDIVILDNNIASIAKAILYGRTIFKSIRKFIIFQLTMNFCAVGVSLICPFIGIETPVTVIQMLWINMIMDTLAGLAFAGEAPLDEYMDEPPKRRNEPIFTKSMAIQIMVTGIYTVALCIAFLKSEFINSNIRYTDDNIYLLTAFFALFIFCGILNCFSARTERLNLFAHLFQNKAFTAIIVFITFIQLIMIYYGGTLFRTAGLTIHELKFVALLSLTVLPAAFCGKIITRTTLQHHHV